MGLREREVCIKMEKKGLEISVEEGSNIKKKTNGGNRGSSDTLLHGAKPKKKQKASRKEVKPAAVNKEGRKREKQMDNRHQDVICI